MEKIRTRAEILDDMARNIIANAGGEISRSDLLNEMQIRASDLNEVMERLVAGGEVIEEQRKHPKNNRRKRVYVKR